MKTNEQLTYLQEKMEEIGTAIFYNLSESVLKLPTSVITELRVDSYGYVWFFVQKPNEELQEFDSGFPVRLDLFRKGLSHYIQVEGNAWVVTDPEEMNLLEDLIDVHNQLRSKDYVLVKVKMIKADIRETSATKRSHGWVNALSLVSSLFGMTAPSRPKQSFYTITGT
jgi:hypothetical protein